jgi:hypothetical protein
MAAPETMVKAKDFVFNAIGTIKTVLQKFRFVKERSIDPSMRKTSGKTNAPKIAVGTKVNQVLNQAGSLYLDNKTSGNIRGM